MTRAEIRFESHHPHPWAVYIYGEPEEGFRFRGAAKKKKEVGFAEAMHAPSEAEAPAPKSSPSSETRPSRRDKKHIGGYFDYDVSRELRQIALDEGSSVQALLAEAIEKLLKSRGRRSVGQ